MYNLLFDDSRLNHTGGLGRMKGIDSPSILLQLDFVVVVIGKSLYSMVVVALFVRFPDI